MWLNQDRGWWKEPLCGDGDEPSGSTAHKNNHKSGLKQPSKQPPK
jgi:hypothetical protein